MAVIGQARERDGDGTAKGQQEGEQGVCEAGGAVIDPVAVDGGENVKLTGEEAGGLLGTVCYKQSRTG